MKAAIRRLGGLKCLDVLNRELALIMHKVNDGLDKTYSLHLSGFQAVIDYVSAKNARQNVFVKVGVVPGVWYKGFRRGVDLLVKR